MVPKQFSCFSTYILSIFSFLVSRHYLDITLSLNTEKADSSLMSTLLWKTSFDYSPSCRLKLWFGKHSPQCVFSGELCSWCLLTARLQCKSQSAPLLLLVISSLDVELKKSPWAGLFHRTRPHTHISQIKTFLDVWVEMGDVVYPSCLTFFQSGGGSELSFSARYMFQKTTLESCAWQCSTHSIIHASDGVERSSVEKASL